MVDMLQWFIENNRDDLDHLGPGECAYINSLMEVDYLDEPATGKWCDEYYTAVFGDVETFDKTPVVVRASNRYASTRYMFDEIMDYLWDNRESILYVSKEMDKPVHAIAKSAIRFVHDVYVQNYMPDIPSNQLISRAKFIGLGDFEDAWQYMVTSFYETATPHYFLKWMEHYIRIFADTMMYSTEVALVETTPLFEAEIIDMLLKNRKDISLADFTLNATLYDYLYDLLIPISMKHIPGDMENQDRYKMISGAISDYLNKNV